MRPLHCRTFNRTKLIATLGPATDQPAQLTALLEAGVDLCRLNFSHSDRQWRTQVLRLIRTWAAQHGRAVGVLGDLCGPKIRLNDVSGERFSLPVGATIRVVRGSAECTPQRLTTTYPTLVDELHVGQRIYLDDGLVRMLVVEREPDALVCTCTTGGIVASRKGVNLPDTTLAIPALTDRDRSDLDWAIDHGVDYLALSFVRTPDDVRELRGILRERQADIGVIVKIEKAQALEHLDELVALADGVMVARGDLGVEMDPWQVPLVQKSLVVRCREAGKPVIIATQMLQSMVERPSPTRAEVSDIANAIFEGADALMLSAETSVGQFPLAAVEIMVRVAEVTEEFLTPLGDRETPASVAGQSRAASAIAQAAVRAARHIGARVVAAWTASGETVRLIARHRLPMPVVGLTFNDRVYDRMNLLYGVIPMRVEPLHDPGQMAALLDQKLLDSGLVRPGDWIVVVTSTRPNTPGATDTVLVHRISPGRER